MQNPSGCRLVYRLTARGKTAVGGIGTAAEHSPTWNAMQNCCWNNSPNSYAMMTIAPEAVDTYTDSVKYLYRLGFRNMNATRIWKTGTLDRCPSGTTTSRVTENGRLLRTAISTGNTVLLRNI